MCSWLRCDGVQAVQRLLSLGTLAANGFTFVVLKEENCVISLKRDCVFNLY